MKWLNKILGIGALAVASLTFNPKKVEACSSAKPLGRGETNVAVADDASAIYWNPAGLIQLERPEIDITLGNNNYKFFLCYGQPLNKDSAFGVNIAHRINTTFTMQGEQIIKTEHETNWVKLGYSKKLTEKLSLGSNLTFRRSYLDGKLLTSDEQPDYPVHIGDTLLTADFGLLYKYNDKIKLGLLLQGPVNVRPGVSFEFDDKTMLVLEGYDILDVTKISDGISKRYFRLGLERKVNDKWSVRTGFKFAKEDYSRCISAGVSYKKNDLETSVALMHWGTDTNSLVLSANKKF